MDSQNMGRIMGINKDKPTAISEEDMPSQEMSGDNNGEFDEINNIFNTVKQEFEQGNIDKETAINELMSSLKEMSDIGIKRAGIMEKSKDKYKKVGSRIIGRNGEQDSTAVDMEG